MCSMVLPRRGNNDCETQHERFFSGGRAGTKILFYSALFRALRAFVVFADELTTEHTERTEGAPNEKSKEHFIAPEASAPPATVISNCTLTISA